MAVSLGKDVIDRITLNNPGTNVVEVIFDEDVRFVEVLGFDAAGTGRDEVYIALTGTDGAALGADYETVLATELYPRRFTMARRARRLGGFSLYLASDTASAIVEVRTSSREP